VIVAAAAALAAFPALAEDVPLPAGVFVEAQTQDQYLAKDHLIRAKVYGKDGTIIADIEDLIINDSNQVVGVVMGTGGYFGLAEKRVGVNLSALKFEEKDGAMSVSLPEATADTMDAAPEFKRTQPPKSLFERARERVLELSEKTTTSTQGALEKAKPTINEATVKAKEALDKAKEAAGEALTTAKKAAEGAIEGAAKALAPREDTTAPATPPADAPSESAAPAPGETTPE
jgi:hypothetical protein